MRGVGTGAVKGEKIGADEQAGLSKAVQEVITDLKKHSFSLVAYSSWHRGVPLQKCAIFHWQFLSSTQSPNQQGSLEVARSG